MRFHLAADLRRVGRAGTEHDLQARVDLGDGVDQVDDALLTRDPADEQDVGRGRIDAVAHERVGGAGRPVLGRVDAIVNDMNPRRLDVEQAEHVLAGLPGHRDDRIRMLHRGPFHPGAEMVAVAELLDFPRPERLERMDAEHERHVPQPAREQAAHVGVPGVAVDDVGIDRVLGHRQRAIEGIERAGKARVGVLLGLGPARIAAHRERRGVAPLLAEAAHLDRDPPGQRPAQVFDVDAGAAVDVRRILVGEQRRLPDLRHRRRSPPVGIALAPPASAASHALGPDADLVQVLEQVSRVVVHPIRSRAL